ncbi:E3 binding domain-containing protein [Calidithermus chliarophilus]|uniref:E3 binding domain-containing protein n=1 Tax=Calidithermus chliarophilus TaxID=52023 RepID=UPI0003FB280A|nr:E3 binding domain-containing protein [Calidithermus chliarophilus]
MSEPQITPLARRLAEENGINWRSLAGSGPDGTIVERDILAYLAKVMAGEITLPPAPDPGPPMPAPAEIPSFAQAQAALEREGINLGELMPEPPRAEPVLAEPHLPDDLDFDLDLDLSTTQETLPPAPSFPEPSPAAPSGFDYAAAPAEPKLEAWEIPSAPAPEPAPAPDLSWEPAEPSIPPAPSWPLPSEPARPEPASFTPAEPEPVFAPAEPEPMPAWEAAAPVAEPEIEPSLEPEVGLPPVPEPVPAAMPDLPPLPSFEPAAQPAVAAAPVAEAEPVVAPAPAPAVAARVQLRQRLVNLAAAREAAATLSEAWRQEVGLAALLYRAADKALADLELTHEPLKGELEGDSLKGYRVAPAHTLRGTLENLAAAREAADGLVILALEGGDVVVFPGAEVLALSQPSEGQALLSYSGSLAAAKAGALLERVGYYLERPILLA